MNIRRVINSIFLKCRQFAFITGDSTLKWKHKFLLSSWKQIYVCITFFYYSSLVEHTDAV